MATLLLQVRQIDTYGKTITFGPFRRNSHVYAEIVPPVWQKRKSITVPALQANGHRVTGGHAYIIVNQSGVLDNLSAFSAIISSIILRVSQLVFANHNPAVRPLEPSDPVMCKENLQRWLGHPTGRPLFEFNQN